MSQSWHKAQLVMNDETDSTADNSTDSLFKESDKSTDKEE
jgi:hypothetical protein